MNIAVLDDYNDTVRTLAAFQKLARHDVQVFTDHVQDTDALAKRLTDFEVLVLIRERTQVINRIILGIQQLDIGAGVLIGGAQLALR